MRNAALRSSRRGQGLALALLLVCAGAARAQTVSSVLAGSVRDAEGRAAGGATVQARSEATGASRTGIVDSDGQYRIDGLSPGDWLVVARTSDGRQSESRQVTLRLQETLRLDLILGAGPSETVQVVAGSPLVDPHRVASDLRIGAAQVDALPLAGRVATDLALLDSSIRSTLPGNFYGERGSVFVVNGQPGRANSFLVDGLDNNDQASGTTLDGFFAQGVIEEFVVLRSQFAAEFGRASGGVLNIVTRRGSNETSGEAFFQLTASGLNGPGDFVSNLPSTGGRDTTRRLLTGFHVGGPIRRDEAFYLIAVEHQDTDDVAPFTGVDRAGSAGGRVAAPSRDDNFFLRTDFNLDPSNTLMLRLSADTRENDGLNVGGGVTPEFGFRLEESDLQLAAAWTHVASPRVLNEARLLLSRSSFDQRASSSRPGVERPSGLFGGNNLNRQIREEDKLQLVDNLTWTAGRHTFKVGYDVLRSRTRIQTRFNPNGNFLYETDAPFEPGDCGDLTASRVARAREEGTYPIVPCPGIEGQDDDGDGVIDEPGIITTYPLVFQLITGEPRAVLDDTRLAVFAQDTWQATSRLRLDYGLRYDLSTFRLPRSTRVPSAIPNGGAGRDRNNFAPRFGFAWEPRGDGRWVLRGGGGVFYDKLVLGFPAIASITSQTEIGLLFAQGLTLEITEDVVEELGIDLVRQGLIFPPELVLRFSTAPRLDTPYSTQFQIGTDWAAGARSAWSAEVVRAQGYHLALLRDLNPVVGTDVLGIPLHRDDTVGSIAATVTEGRSWYTGLNLGWRYREGDTWLTATYTWSKSLDLGPDPLKGGIALPPDSDDLAGEKGRSDADRRHRFVLAGRVGLPWLGLVASGAIHLASGAPFNVTTGRDDNLDGIASDRPPGVGRNTGEDTPLGPVNALRESAGLPGVGSLREPSFAQLDLRVAKPFAVRGRRGEVFLQVFNLLDRLNAGPIEGRALSRGFGRPIGLAGPPRTVETGLKLAF